MHRNIANTIRENDPNSASVIEYAVAHVKVNTIILCGHTKCGGAIASLGDADLGHTLKNQAELDKLPSEDAKSTKLAELHVEAGLDVVRKNATVQKAIKERGLTVHGGIYDIASAEFRVLDDGSN